MCPFGSTFMSDKQLPENFDLDGYDPNALDSDDEPFSDLEL